MNNKVTLALIGILSLSSAAMAQMGNGQGMMHNGGQHQYMMGQQLNLTTEQQTQMQQLHNQMQAENQTYRDARRAEMQKFYDNPTFNEAEAKNLAQKHRDDRAVRKMKYRHAMNQILTPEQRAQHQSMMQNHHNGQRGHMMQGQSRGQGMMRHQNHHNQ